MAKPRRAEQRFQSRVDEPEAALSPTWQLSLMVAMQRLVERGSQFIIATHSPILLGYPEAEIL